MQTKEEADSQRIGFLRDHKASRRYTVSSFTRKTLRRSRVELPLDQWSETTTHQKKAERYNVTWRTSHHSLSLVYRQASSSSFSPTSPTSSSQEAVTPTQHPASMRSKSMSDEVRGDSSRGPTVENQDYEGSLQKTHWSSSAQSGKIGD